MIAGKVERFVERRFVIATVVIQARRRVEREFARLGKIPAADIDRIHFQFSRHDIHCALDDIGRFRPARAAIGIRGHFVGEDARHVHLNCGNAISTRKH